MAQPADMAQALKASEERFAKAFNFSQVPMTISRLRDGVFIEANAADERVLGYRREEIIGRSSLDIGTWDSAQSRQQFIDLLHRDGRVMDYPTRMRNRHGEAVDTVIWAELIEIAGEPCVLASTLNVTAQRRRETQLLEVAQGVSGETGEAFFGSLVLHLGRAIGADLTLVSEIRAPGQPDDVMSSLATMQDGVICTPMVYPLAGSPCEQTLLHREPFICADAVAQRFPALGGLAEGGFRAYAGVALHDADGSAIGVLVALWRQPLPQTPDLQTLLQIFASRCSAELIRLRRDREIRKLSDTLEQRVRERTAQLEAVNQELDSFAYSVAHDLKSPLRAIDGYAQMLWQQMDGRLTPGDRQLFERLLGSAARMNELIADLLALARVSQGTLSLEPVDLSAMCRQIIANLRQNEPQRVVRAEIQDGIVVLCDGKLARIVLENLLSNAWKYSCDSAQACIEFGTTALPGRACALFVRDNGVGFDMQHAGNLFKPFSRLHPDQHFEGTGIGLATVHRILERHGGSIQFEAQPGAGASFYFGFEPAL